MGNFITPEEIAHFINIWYPSDADDFVTHAWLAGLETAIPSINPAKRFAGKLRDAVLHMPRDEFFALMSEELK